MIKIPYTDFVPLDQFEADYPVLIDVVYAQADHPDNVFGQLYHPNARMWAHKDIAAVVLKAAQDMNKDYGWILKIDDCFRPTEAQAIMHAFGFPDELVAGPGIGGHPRGMAIDVEPYLDGRPVDMGTSFDYFTVDISDNPAARNYTKFPDDVLDNRKKLELAMVRAADDMGHKLLPLPSEWWDFRFYPDYFNQFAPLSDKDLPESMRVMESSIPERAAG